MNEFSKIMLAALGTGVAGWALENTLFGKRYSALLPGVPFLPVYAVGGAAIALAQPRLQGLSPVTQALIYGGMLTSLEAVAGTWERSEGRMSWDYGGTPVDLPHAAAWGVLGYLASEVIRKI